VNNAIEDHPMVFRDPVAVSNVNLSVVTVSSISANNAIRVLKMEMFPIAVDPTVLSLDVVMVSKTQEKNAMMEEETTTHHPTPVDPIALLHTVVTVSSIMTWERNVISEWTTRT